MRHAQILKARWPRHVLQTLVEVFSKDEALKGTGPGYSFKTLLKSFTEAQGVKVLWPHHLLQTWITIPNQWG